MNKKCKDKIKNHISICNFGDILFFSESENYIYAVHYFYGDGSHTNELWLNICRKDAAYAYSYYLNDLFSQKSLLAKLCMCNNYYDNNIRCLKCFNEVLKHIKTNKEFNNKLKTILLLG